MSDSPYLKCPCQNCGASIEFPADVAGANIECPHCHEHTALFIPAPDFGETSHSDPPTSPASDEGGGDASAVSPASSPGKTSRTLITAVVLLAVSAVIVGGLFLMRHNPAVSESASTESKAANSVDNASEGTPTNSEARTPKSLADLKAGTITLEKAKGSSLVYAVGILRNDSDHQRFGVHVEVELSDAKGGRAGTAKDYRAVIEPRQEWRFRALVLDSKAVSARLGSIREEE